MIKKIKKNNKKIILFSIIVFSLFLFNNVSAYEKIQIDVDFKNDFVVGPGRTEVLLNPGETVVKTITVTNRVNETVTFLVQEEDFTGSDNPNVPVVLLGDEAGPYSLKDFIESEVTEFTLRPGEQIRFNATISVPADSEPGGYYGALVISNQEKALDDDGNAIEQSTGQTKIISRIGSLFLVRVNGPVDESGYLDDFKLIEEKKVYPKRPDGFEIFYKNDGTVHLVPYGTIEIKNIFGKVVDILPVDAYAVLPDSTRYRQIFWQDGFSLGYYSVNLNLYKGYGEQYDQMEIGFWVLPWNILAYVLIGLLIISFFIYFITSKFEFRRKEK